MYLTMGQFSIFCVMRRITNSTALRRILTIAIKKKKCFSAYLLSIRKSLSKVTLDFNKFPYNENNKRMKFTVIIEPNIKWIILQVLTLQHFKYSSMPKAFNLVFFVLLCFNFR